METSSIAPSLPRIPALDGWRGISILLVLIGHMLPLGPKSMHLNAMVSAAGLCIFFFLSGFLVISILLRNGNVASFLVRRLFRILPLAILVLVPLLLWQQVPLQAWLANFLFYANLNPENLLHPGDHLWSLSVEVQFYAAMGLAVLLFGRRAVALVPIACLAITALRVANGMGYSIVTWFRVDEILVGGSVAYLMNMKPVSPAHEKWWRIAPYVLAPLFLLCCHDQLKVLNYIRPYIGGLLIFSTMHRPKDILQRILVGPQLRYLANTSYALYVIHPVTYAGWMGEGVPVLKYTKRTGSFLLTFAFAHFSTSYYESYFNKLGHRLAKRLERAKGEGADKPVGQVEADVPNARCPENRCPPHSNAI